MDSSDAKEIGEAREMAQDRYDDLLAQRDRLREALKEILFEVARVEFLENKKIIYDVLRAEARAALEASKP